MAEETNVTTNPEVVDETVDVEALKAENEQNLALIKKYKASIDKLTKEAADKKREERARMTEEERVKAEQTEEYERLKAQAEADASELNYLKAVNAYKTYDEETVKKLVECVNDKDHKAIADLIDKIIDKAIKEKEAEWIKSRPAATVGNGSFPTMTKEQIKAIKDPVERQQKIAENIALFT